MNARIQEYTARMYVAFPATNLRINQSINEWMDGRLPRQRKQLAKKLALVERQERLFNEMQGMYARHKTSMAALFREV